MYVYVYVYVCVCKTGTLCFYPFACYISEIAKRSIKFILRFHIESCMNIILLGSDGFAPLYVSKKLNAFLFLNSFCK